MESRNDLQNLSDSDNDDGGWFGGDEDDDEDSDHKINKEDALFLGL